MSKSDLKIRKQIAKSNKEKRKSMFKFIGLFIGSLLLIYGFLFTDFYLKNLSKIIISVNANISGLLLNLFNQDVQVKEGGVISSTVFSISVKKGCDGVEAMGLFVAALVSFPSAWRFKLKSLAIGIPILFTVNIIRIISLFLTGVYFPDFFELMHVEVWQVLFIMITLGLWIFMIKKNQTASLNVQ